MNLTRQREVHGEGDRLICVQVQTQAREVCLVAFGGGIKFEGETDDRTAVVTHAWSRLHQPHGMQVYGLRCAIQALDRLLSCAIIRAAGNRNRFRAHRHACGNVLGSLVFFHTRDQFDDRQRRKALRTFRTSPNSRVTER
jgi:hypothetical protein